MNCNQLPKEQKLNHNFSLMMAKNEDTKLLSKLNGLVSARFTSHLTHQ